MSNQIVISSGAKVRNLDGVLTGSTGVVGSVPLGAANGVATLDSGGKVPVSQLPSSVVTYLGTWNAATNTPTLTNGTGDAGDMYICNVAGTVNFGAGPITFAVGDWVLYGSGTWQKSNGQNGTVTSVAVTESGDALSITGSPITTAGTINIGFAGNSGQYINGEGNLTTFPSLITEAQNLVTEVYNSTGATLTKGTVVYINGGQGNLPTITKAIATGDSTSAQTYGVVRANISNNNNGYVTVIGSLTDIDTQAYAAGTQLYLSGTTAGAWTSTKPSAPIHLVYVGIVVRSHPTQGVVEIRIQNGYEISELHDVAISSVANNDGIFYNSSNDLWENKTIDEALGYTPANDSLVVKLAGTQTITGSKTFSLAPRNDGGILLKDGVTTGSSGYVSVGSNGAGLTIGVYNSGTTYFHELLMPYSASYNYTFPAATGTLALLEGAQTFSGAKAFTQNLSLDGNGSNAGTLLLKSNSALPTAIGYSSLNTTSNTIYLTTYVSNPKTAAFDLSGITDNTIRIFTLPNTSGTLALTSQLTSGTVTSVGLSSATSGVTIGSSPITTSGTITLAIATASGSQNGLLSSSDWTTFNNKQNALTNPVTGTGTTNYLPKFTGTSTIGNSILSESGYTLTQTSSNALSVYVIKGTGSTTGLWLYTNGANATLSNQDNGSLAFQTNGTDRLTIASNGAATFSSQVNAESFYTNDTRYIANQIMAGYNANSEDSDIWINYTGYQGGATRFRDFRIGNGKQGQIAFFDGSTSNVGIGTSSPTARLEVYGGESNMGLLNISGVYGGIIRFLGSGVNKWGITVEDGLGSDKFGIFDYGATGGTGYRLVIDNSGNVGIGTSSPDNYYSTKLVVAVGDENGITIAGTGDNFLMFADGQTGLDRYRGFIHYSHDSNFLAFGSDATERMRITSSGVVAMNQNTTYGSETLEITNKISGGAQYGILMSGNPASYTNYAMRFHYTGVAIVGSITFNTTSTSYNTSSDYRLKQDLKDFSGLNLVSAIKAYDYEWKEDNSRSYGVLAHELQEIVPYAVNGNKDDKEMQGVDYSKLVPILIKSIQELQAKIVTLESKIN